MGTKDNVECGSLESFESCRGVEARTIWTCGRVGVCAYSSIESIEYGK